MPNISNVNIPSTSKKKIHSKLTFNAGEKISAKLISVDELKKTAILKLVDGWQFSAEIDGLEELLDYLPSEGFGKFKVIGNKNGRLLLKLIKEDALENKKDSNSLEKFIREKLNVKDKNNFEMIYKMLKHNIQLTRENVARIKNIVDFQSKLLLNDGEQDVFIEKYLITKNVMPTSEKGKNISSILRNFFGKLKNMDLDTLLTFIENDIELTDDNIRSFDDLFNKSFTIYDNLEEISKNKYGFSNNRSNINIGRNVGDKEKIEHKSNDNIVSDNKNNDMQLTDKHIDKNFSNGNIDDMQLRGKHIDENFNNGNINAKDSDNVNREIENIKMENNKIINKIKIQGNDISKIKTDTLVKNDITNKIDDMKEIIKSIINDKLEIKSQLYNNFKVFNLVSNQYYYFDIPLNIYKNQYPCKLIIKDDRKKGKKIDSKNVKIVTSVKTINMGTVDAYIVIHENAMNIDIKCDKKWIQMFEEFKDKLLDELATSSYNATIKIDEREKEVDLINCREFFEDKNLGRIDTRV